MKTQYIYVFLTSTLVDVNGQLHALAALPIGYEPGRAQGSIWTRGQRKILEPTGTRTQTPRSSIL
jgi:hypothetical protein